MNLQYFIFFYNSVPMSAKRPVLPLLTVTPVNWSRLYIIIF